MFMQVAVEGRNGQGERNGSIVDGRTPSWWTIAVVLARADRGLPGADMCLQILL